MKIYDLPIFGFDLAFKYITTHNDCKDTEGKTLQEFEVLKGELHDALRIKVSKTIYENSKNEKIIGLTEFSVYNLLKAIGENDKVGIQHFEEKFLGRPTISHDDFYSRLSESVKSLVEYKTKQYGNAALEPLEIFAGKAKYGYRIDEKLSRVKNSNELRKNDICDLLGGLYLICKEKGWDNFDEFKD